MKLFVFVCKNTTNIWAGIGARLWAVSEADPTIMKARETRAKEVRIGNCGIIYCSAEDKKSLTTPFIFTSAPKIGQHEENVWPERWQMPFSIHPLGSPRKQWKTKEALVQLPFNKGTGNTNVTSALKAVGTAVFTPNEIGDDDWAMLLSKLSAEID